jgi:hypothetical protein
MAVKKISAEARIDKGSADKGLELFVLASGVHHLRLLCRESPHVSETEAA